MILFIMGKPGCLKVKCCIECSPNDRISTIWEDRIFMNKSRQKTKRWKITLTVLIAVGAILSAVCVIYLNDYYCADAAVSEALKSDDEVKVEWIDDNGIVFWPKEPEAGLIFYPGGKVEFTAYAPLLRSLAEEGVLCVLIKMPCNLAVLDIDAAEGIQERFPEIVDWYIGGHSLGGAMAAGYVAEHVDEYKGLILLAAYSTKDISKSGLQVLSVYGSEDGVLDIEKYTDNRTNLPADMEEQIIEGGCHAQFGSYGKQEGDGEPGISSEEQRKVTAQYIAELMADSD